MAFHQANVQVGTTIRAMRPQGFSIQTIKKALHVGQARIKWCIENEEEACFHDVRGRPPVVTPEIRNFVEECTLFDGRLSNADMSDQVQQAFGVHIHSTTIAHLQQDLKFKYRPRIICQQLTPVRREQRLCFVTCCVKKGLMWSEQPCSLVP